MTTRMWEKMFVFFVFWVNSHFQFDALVKVLFANFPSLVYYVHVTGRPIKLYKNYALYDWH